MICPHLDNELERHIVHGKNGIDTSYYACPTCEGKWLTTFDANYIQTADFDDDKNSASSRLAGRSSTPLTAPRRCPVCQKFLKRALEDSIPPDVTAFRCPTGDGYFFPTGELTKFKTAQDVNLTYHKLWQIPISSLGSTLLVGILGLVLSVGLVIGSIQSQKTQIVTSQATDFLVSQQAFVIPQTQSATVVARTQTDGTMTVAVRGPTSFTKEMTVQSNHAFVATFLGLPKGVYIYTYHFTTNNVIVTSKPYSFRIP